MIRYSCILLVLSLLCSPLFSQKTKTGNEKSFSDRITFGGNFGLQFGNATLIDISPNVGYYLRDNVVTGIGLTYKYYRFKDFYKIDNGQYIETYDYKVNMMGGSVFTSYYIKSDFVEILNNIFLHAEYEPLLLKFDEYMMDPYLYDIIVNKRSEWVHSIFVGGGYRQQLGERVFFHILALWNLNESYYTPYENPVIRIGINVGY